MIDLTELVAEELARIFPDITKYTENQTGGFDVPSFYISRAGKTLVNPKLFNVQERAYPYQIVYFADPERPNADMEEKQEILSDNFINLADQATVRNREFNQDTDQQTLVFNFNVLLRMMPAKPAVMEGDAVVNGGIKDN